MNRLFIIYFTFLFLSVSSAFAESPSPEKIEELKTQQQALTTTQDSLQNLLNQSRGSFAGATPEVRDSLSTLIVKLEGEIFDVRAQLGSIGSELTDIEEMQTLQLLREASENSKLKNLKVYETDRINIKLSGKDLEVLKNANNVKENTAANVGGIKTIYDSLLSLKAKWNSSMVQSEIDSLATEGATLKESIKRLDKEIGLDWKNTYDHILGLYLMMLDSAPNAERTTLEKIDNQSREVRRKEAFMQQSSLAPNLTVFPLQLSLLKSYEDAIASAIQLSGNYSIFVKDSADEVDLSNIQDIEFGERILTIYSEIVHPFTYGYSTTDEIPELILPDKGIYYSCQVAVLTKQAQQLSMFRESGPVQVCTNNHKFQYILGGFKTFDEAEAGVAALKKIGFRAPTIVVWIDGEKATIKEAKAWEEEAENAEKFKVVMTTESAADGEVLREAIELHAKGKVVSRIAADGKFIFTTTQFSSKEEAEVFAQILRDKAAGANVAVEGI